MNAVFIARKEETFHYKGPFQPAVFFRREFDVDQGLLSASLDMTALGHYIPFVNGQKPDGRLLAPGYTEYSKRLQYQSYNIISLIREGHNTIGACLGDGWYRGSCGPMGMRGTYGDTIALAAELTLVYADRTETIRTDPEAWKCTADGPFLEQDIRRVERYDACKEMPDWCMPGFDDSSWEPCITVPYTGTLIPDEGEAVLAHECFTPEILHTPDGGTVLDFGQNMAGHVTFTVTGAAGQTVRLLHGEALDEQGNFTVKNIGNDLMPLGQELIYVLKEGTQTYTTQFMICGFRYVKLENWPEPVLPQNFEAAAVYSDVRMTGTFTCSNEKINRLVKNVEWSLKSNFIDIPTDCPQRERAGWTGDINVFIECADLFADTRRFISKWLKDVVLTQTEDGAILSVVPAVYMMNRKTRESSPGAAGWSDAITRIPMQQYLAYGDPSDLEECYEAMRKYVEYNVRRAKKNSPRSLLHRTKGQRFILDTGFHYGEWLEPGAANLVDALKAILMPDAEVATAWFYYSAKTLSEAAKLLGKEQDVKRYRSLSHHIRKAYLARFIPEGKVRSRRQCKYVRPLYMGIVKGTQAQQIASQLNDLVVQNHYRIGTGFLTTYQILNVLSDNGFHETACRMMENEDCPGWLYEVDHGATTIWEGWDAIDPKTGKLKSKSLNHYSPGAAASWLFTRLCGIRAVKPGYREIVIAPKPGGSLTWACASYDSVAGRIVSDWKIDQGRFTLRAEIPDGVKATVILPDGTKTENAVSGVYTCPC